MGRGTASGRPQTNQQEVVNWDGPLKKHHCTDIFCLLLFLVFLAAWAFVAFMAFKDGDISKVKKEHILLSSGEEYLPHFKFIEY
jgi:hypothetical protein